MSNKAMNMSMIGIIKQYLKKKPFVALEKPAEEAYDIWSASYDAQPGNLMLDLDQQLFTVLLNKINIAGKRVIDIGCGTGRHWPAIYSKDPANIRGYDISSGMLEQLKRKYPDAITVHTADDLLQDLPDHWADCIISTLTIAHIKDPEKAIASWARVLNENGSVILTDFHPAILADGGKRSFSHEGRSFFVTNYVYSPQELKDIFKKYGLFVTAEQETAITEKVKHYYVNKHAEKTYERYKGMPVIYGMLLKKENAAQ